MGIKLLWVSIHGNLLSFICLRYNICSAWFLAIRISTCLHPKYFCLALLYPESQYVCVFICLPLRLLITSGICGTIWTPYDWLNKLYSLCMPTIFSIISIRIETCHRNQPKKSKLVLCKPLLYCNSY